MRKILFLNNWLTLYFSFIILNVLLMPGPVFAGPFYHCVDKNGNESLLDSPMDDQTCVPMKTFDEKSASSGKDTFTVPEDKITKIIVKGNQVLVPVTVIHDNREEDIHLILDTGATATTIHSAIADRLYINLGKAQKAKGEVVGGAVIDASVVKMDILKIGPHTIRDKNIFIVHYEGNASKFDGLLGLDVLGKFSYKIDFAKRIIIWE